MQFNSWLFLFLFLPIVLLCYFLLNRYLSKKTAAYFLILGNFFFYAYADIYAAIYFIICILSNYVISKALIKYKKKALFVLGLIANLGAL